MIKRPDEAMKSLMSELSGFEQLRQEASLPPFPYFHAERIADYITHLEAELEKAREDVGRLKDSILWLEPELDPDNLFEEEKVAIQKAKEFRERGRE